MPWLLVNPGSPEAWTVELRPGSNSIGRSNANDFQLDDPSVSGCHCQIVVDNENLRIKDLGSTNGTFVNQAPVREAALRSGQTIHLGMVEMILCAEAPKGEARHPVRTAPAAPVAHQGSPISGHITSSTLALPVSVPSLAAGPQVCKFHPRTPARFLCGQCHRYYCELCVNTRGRREFCRACGAECVPVQVQIQLAPRPKGFYARLPGALVFPFRGSGVLVLIVGTLLLALVKAGGGMGGGGLRGGMSFGWWGLMARVIVLGYLFTYMQSIIHSTALGEEKMPPLPDITNFWEDILLPCLQLIGLTLISFAPAIAVGGWVIATEQDSVGVLLFSAFTLGCLYFPMAFLAVAMLDCVAAAHPLQVIPSIFRVPLEYLVALIALAGVLGIRALGDVTLQMLFPKGLGTRSISTLLEMFAAQAFWSLVSLYLLTVGMRILGLLYVARKDKLGWYNR